MSNQWMLGLALVVLLGIFTGSAYLLVEEQLRWAWLNSLWRADWVWWLFLGAVLVAMLLNLLLFVATPSVLNLLKKRHYQSDPQRQQQFAAQQQLFFQQYGALLQSLGGKTDIYLYADGNNKVLLQLFPELAEPAGLEQICQLFQLMLVHQCDSALVIAVQPMTPQARIFAREAQIVQTDFVTLARQLGSNNFIAAIC